MDKGERKSNRSRCRICLSDSTHLTSIFTLQMGGEPTIGDMLTSFCSFQLTKDDDSFDQICGECSKQTLSAYNFKLKCEKSHELLVRQAQAKESDAETEHRFAPFETVNMDYIDPDSATDEADTEDTKLGLLSLELDLPCPDTETDCVPTESAGTESVVTPNNEGPRNEDIERTPPPTVIDVDEEERTKIKNFIMSFHTYALTGPVKFHCSICSYTCELESRLQTHILFLHSRKKLRWFQSRLKKPIKKPRTKRFTCDLCGFSCIQKLDLVEHFLKHTGQKPLQCTICGVFVRYRRGLRDHMKTHSVEKQHARNVHLRNNNLNNKKWNELFLCDLCGKSFTTKVSLTVHIRIHTGEKPYSCCSCKFSTSNREYLKIHKRIHSGEKPFACDECSRSFPSKANLIMHKLTHSGVKAFSCDRCNRSFAAKGNLKAHMYTHTGERPFACDLCDFSTSHKTKLKYHLLSHSGKKPFSCKVCNFSCARNNALKTHMLSHADACTE